MNDKPVHLFVLGCRAAGKTSFLLGLDILCRPNQNPHFTIAKQGETSAKYLKELHDCAQNRTWPPATPRTTPVHFDLWYKSTNLFQIEMLDYPGEDFKTMVETLSEIDKDEIYHAITQADVVFLLVDPTQDLLSDHNRLEEDVVLNRQKALVEAMGQLVKHRNHSKKVLPVLAIILSKSDFFTQDDCLKFKSDNKMFLQNIKSYSRINDVKIFPLSCVAPLGSNSNQKPELPLPFPEEPNPSGYDKLFAWTSDQFWFRKHKTKIFFGVVAFVVTLLIIIGSILHTKDVEKNEVAIIHNASLSEVSHLLSRRSRLSSAREVALDNRVVRELQRLESDAKLATRTEDFNLVLDRYDALLALPHLENTEPIHQSRAPVAKALENHYFSLVSRLSGPEQARLAQEYLRRFPGGVYRDIIKDIVDEVAAGATIQMINDIIEAPLNDQSSIRNKLSALNGYLNEKGSTLTQTERSEVQRAISVISMLSSAPSVRLVPLRVGYSGDQTTRAHRLEWRRSAQELAQYRYSSDSRRRESNIRNIEPEIPASQWYRALELHFFARDWPRPNPLLHIGTYSIDVLNSLPNYDGKTPVEIPVVDPRIQGLKPWVVLRLQVRSVSDGWRELTDDERAAYANWVFPAESWSVIRQRISQ